MSIPLVQNNEKDSINTSIIAIKKNLERINSILGLVDSGSDIDTSEFVKKSDIVDVVQSGNMNPVTSNAVVPVDTVTSGDMHSVTSNAVAKKVSYSTTEQLTGGKWIDGKPIYRKCGYEPTVTSTSKVIDNTLTSSYVDTLINTKTIFTYYGNKVNGCGWISDTQRLSILVQSSGLVQAATNISIADISGGYYWIVEYTKTTD